MKDTSCVINKKLV